MDGMFAINATVLASIRFNETQIYQPCNLLVLPFPGLDLQTLVVHLVDVTGCLHVAQNVILQIPDRLQRVRHVLVLLHVADDIRSLGPFGEVDQIGLLDHRGDTVFNEGQIGQIDT